MGASDEGKRNVSYKLTTQKLTIRNLRPYRISRWASSCSFQVAGSYEHLVHRSLVDDVRAFAAPSVLSGIPGRQGAVASKLLSHQDSHHDEFSQGEIMAGPPWGEGGLAMISA